MKALITAGRTSRLRPFTDTKNKHLIELANRPMIFYALEKVIKAGIIDIGIIVEENDEEIHGALGDGGRFGVSLTYIRQVGGARGIAHAIYCARDFLQDEPFLLYLGDNIIQDDIAPLCTLFERGAHNCLLTLARVPKPERFGVPELDRNGRIVRVEERPVNPKSPYAVAGLYFYDSNVHTAFENIKPSFRGDYEISDLHTWLAQNGYSVHYEKIKHWWKDRGSAADLLEGNRMALTTLEARREGSVEEGVTVDGPVSIGKGSRVGGTTVIRGPVTIGEYCLIKDSYIGPYTSVGNKTELHGANVEYSMLYEGVSITTPKKLTNSIVGAYSLVGSARHEMPPGTRLVTGEHGSISI